jgi:dimethylargininase
VIRASTSDRFRRAVVRPPCSRFAEGLTAQNLGKPDLERALEQHERYCTALERCGLSLTRLEPDDRYPDSTFVEDTAILTPSAALLARPGAASRTGEVEGVASALASFYPQLSSIRAPGSLDGGDVCLADGHFLIGISDRTNAEGARQLARWAEDWGFSSVTVDIREMRGLLHLKSGLAYLGQGKMAVIGVLSDHPALAGYDRVPVPEGEAYAANCILVNGRVLVASGFPDFEAALRSQGCEVLTLDMSEFRKMDGGLSCLSLRF